MTIKLEFHYESALGELLSTAVVAAIAEANNEDVLEKSGVSVKTLTRTYSIRCFKHRILA